MATASRRTWLAFSLAVSSPTSSHNRLEGSFFRNLAKQRTDVSGLDVYTFASVHQAFPSLPTGWIETSNHADEFSGDVGLSLLLGDFILLTVQSCHLTQPLVARVLIVLACAEGEMEKCELPSSKDHVELQLSITQSTCLLGPSGHHCDGAE